MAESKLVFLLFRMWLGVWWLLWRGLLLKFFIIYSSQSAVESYPSACWKWNLSLRYHLRRTAGWFGDAQAPSSPPLPQPRGCFLRTAAARSLSFALVGWLLLPSVSTGELRVHPSAVESCRCQITKRGRRKNFHLIRDLVWIEACKTAAPSVQEERRRTILETRLTSNCVKRKWKEGLVEIAQRQLGIYRLWFSRKERGGAFFLTCWEL